MREVFKPRQMGCSRFVAYNQHKMLWEAMFPNSPFPYDWGPVMTADGLMTFGMVERQRHLPVPISHYKP